MKYSMWLASFMMISYIIYTGSYEAGFMFLFGSLATALTIWGIIREKQNLGE